MKKFECIKDYIGLYNINRIGEVESLERDVIFRDSTKRIKGCILKPRLNKQGYYYVNLYKDNKRKTHKIHILVAKTFIGEYDSKYLTIDHIDKNKQNNNLTNLRIISIRDNSNNRRDNSIYGVGVVNNKKRKINNFHTSIIINGKKVDLGYFDTSEKASYKYQYVKKQIEEIEKITRNYTFTRTKSKTNGIVIDFFEII